MDGWMEGGRGGHGKAGPSSVQKRPSHSYLAYVEVALELGAARGDIWVMFVLAVSVEELRVHLQRLFEREGTDADQVHRFHLAVLRAEDLRARIDFFQPRLNRRQLGLVSKVNLVEQDAVGCTCKRRTR